MEWVILFVISWIVFLLLVEWKNLKVNIWGGILSIVLQMSIDRNAVVFNLYKIENGIVSVLGSSLFFVLGPVFVIGILLVQVHPLKRFLTIANVFAASALYSIQELLLISRNVLVYVNWNMISSIVVNIGAMIIISWFAIVVLKKGVYWEL
jgi:hypothetical protein